MIFALLFLAFLIIGAVIYFINKKFNFFGSFGKFMLGLGLAIVLAIVFFILILTLSATNIVGGDNIFIFLMFIGLSQLIYIIPIILLTIRNKQYDMMKGVITGAVLIALLNGSCYLFLLPNMRIGG